MKHLKKILIALVLLCLLAATAVFAISAAGSTIDELRTLYGRVENYSDAEGKAGQLLRAYNYLAENPIDPETEGFAELYADMQKTSVEVANMLYVGIPINPDTQQPQGSPLEWIVDLNKVYDHFDKCPVEEGIEGYAEIIAKLDADNTTLVQELYRLAVDETTAPRMARQYLTTVFDQVEKYPLSEASAQLLADCKAAAYQKGLALKSEYEALVGVAGDDAYMKRLNVAGTLAHFVANVDMSGIDGAINLINDANAIKRAADDEKNAKMIALDSVSDFAAYSWTEYRQTINLDDGKSFNAINSNATHFAETRVDATGNKYYTLVYGTDASHLYIEPQNKTDEMGLVHNVDLMFGDNFYSCGFQARQPSYVVWSLFSFYGDRQGNIRLENGTGAKEKLDNIVEQNVWFTLTVTFDPVTRAGEVYINYVKVFDVLFHADATFTGYRMGVNTINQEISFDNYDVYQGTEFRIWDKFEKMTDEERFMYYVDYFTDASYNPTNRNSAYLKARELIAIIPDSEQVMPYKERFLQCDYNEEIRKPAMELNLATIKDMVSELPEISEITSETRAVVAEQLKEIDEFIALNNELIDRSDNSEGGYLAQVAILDASRDAISRVITVEKFITALSKFNRATSYASLSKHAATADAIFNEAGYSNPANVKFVENDPVVRAFELKFDVNIDAEGNPIPTDDPNYYTAFEYYTTFAKTIAERVKFENSKRIIDCITFITSMPGYEHNEEFWGGVTFKITVTNTGDAAIADLEMPYICYDAAGEEIGEGVLVIDKLAVGGTDDFICQLPADAMYILFKDIESDELDEDEYNDEDFTYKFYDEYCVFTPIFEGVTVEFADCEFSANADYISKYVTIIRDLIYARYVAVANNFDLEYEGVAEALEIFYSIDEYCYEILQKNHIEVIEEQLDAFEDTDAYIEKVGICTYLKSYIAEGELIVYLVYDEDDNYTFEYNTKLIETVAARSNDEADELRSLLYRYQLYTEELAQQETDYESILENNTAYFIDTVKVLKSVTSYAEKREIADIATLYYYGMNVDSDEAKEAIEYYNEVIEELTEKEFIAESFFLAVEYLEYLNGYAEMDKSGIPEEELLTEEDIKNYRYFVLASCKDGRKDVDMQIAGVADAAAIFDAEFEAYEELALGINAEVAEANGVALAARMNVLGANALAVIANIIG